MARSMDGVDTVESKGFLVVGCLAVRQGISGARRLPFSPPADLPARLQDVSKHVSLNSGINWNVAIARKFVRTFVRHKRNLSISDNVYIQIMVDYICSI